jgi:hypothetical protein
MNRNSQLAVPDERKEIHLPVNSNIPPTVTTDWLLYSILMYVLL